MSNIFNLPSAEQIDELNTNLFNLILAEEEDENNLNLTSWSQIQRVVRSGTAALFHRWERLQYPSHQSHRRSGLQLCLQQYRSCPACNII